MDYKRTGLIYRIFLGQFHLALLLCSIATSVQAQHNPSALLNIGDAAPGMPIRQWLKGSPVQRFEKGHLYVLEFWATWCKPCIASMPHLSALSQEYSDKVTIIAVDVKDIDFIPIEKIKAFVDSTGDRMNFRVAVDDSNIMVEGWIETTGEQNNGIPRTFIVNAEGKLAWIGHPKDLDKVLPSIVNNTWKVEEALSKRNSDRYLEALDDSLNIELMNYNGNPDSILLAVSKILEKEPKLKYAPFMAFNTFSSLIKTSQRKAYEYGKEVLLNPTFEEPASDAVIRGIEVNADQLNLQPAIYQLGAEAFQCKIDQIPYPELINMSGLYSKMAYWYWRANEKLKAIDAQEKAIEALKSKKGFSKINLTALELRLREYKKS